MADKFLLESGDFLLIESGDHLLLEELPEFGFLPTHGRDVVVLTSRELDVYPLDPERLH